MSIVAKNGTAIKFIPPARIARFLSVHYTKTGINILNEYKMYQIVIHKISQMPLKYSECPYNISTFSHLRSSKICPKRDLATLPQAIKASFSSLLQHQLFFSASC
jgi:hypothetical protein